MDAAEREVTASDRDRFRATRRQDYNRLLVGECLTGENISPEILRFVTDREVQAGRMLPDDELRRLATSGFGSVPERPAVGGGWRRMFSLRRKGKV